MTGCIQIVVNRRPDCTKVTWWNPRIDGDFLDAPNLEEATRKAPRKPAFMSVSSQDAIFFGGSADIFNPPSHFYLLLPLQPWRELPTPQANTSSYLERWQPP